MDSARMLLSLLELTEAGTGEASHLPEAADWPVSRPLLQRLLSALTYRDEATVLHSRRVALLAVGMARFLGWEESATRQLETAALLHDLGKLGIPDHILRKPARLTPHEQEFVLLHHYIGVDLLQACRLDREIIEIVWLAHTQGRPRADEATEAKGLATQGARLLAIADAYDSLRNHQSYRRGKSHHEAMRILMEHSGKEYDRNVVSALDRWIRQIGPGAIAAETGTRLTDVLEASVDASTVAQAGTLNHLFAFLYLLEALYDGFCLLDAEQQFVVWNHGMDHLTGRSVQEMLGASWSRRLLTFADSKRAPLADRVCPMHKSQVTGLSHCQTVWLENQRTGRWHEVEVQAIPLVGEDRRPRGTALLLRNVSGERESGRYQALLAVARRDPLTGVGNRGELESRLSRMFQARRDYNHSAPFSVMFIDLDHFKSINDGFGHSVGDRVLINLARLVEDELYSGETVCRYGGEEFVVLCPETDLAAAVARAERIRTTILNAPLAAPLELNVTASFGVAEAEPGDDVASLLHRADEALYEAKRLGRNRTCAHSAHHDPRLTLMEPHPLSHSAGSAPLVYVTEFETRVAADIITHKLAGFVDDMQARLTTVKPNYVDLRVGRRGLFGFWGDSPDRQPVQVVLEIGDPQQKGRWATELVTIRATVRPIGRCGGQERFRRRATQVVQELRAYFAAT
jgi:diguanylate cyclase (GGDEF)-like protein/putative nucleotidyltransferase with HDIG domain